jgi:hypothetical protein
MTLKELRQRLDASAGRIAKAKPSEQASVLAREVNAYGGDAQDFARNELALLVAKLETDRAPPNSTMTTGDYYKNMGAACVILLVVLAISAGISKWTGGFLPAMGVTCGGLFLVALLPILLSAPNLSKFQQEALRMYLALAAAGVGGGLPGFIEFERKSTQGTVSAGGALALFLIVYWKSPELFRRRNE